MKAMNWFKKQTQNPWFIATIATATAAAVVTATSIVIFSTNPSNNSTMAQLESEKDAALSELQAIDEEISSLESKIASTNNPEEKAQLETEIADRRSTRSKLDEKVTSINKQIQEEKSSQDAPSQDQSKQDNKQENATDNQSSESNDESSEPDNQNSGSSQESEQPSYVPVSRVEINCPSEDVHPHTSIDLTATVYPSNATNQNIYWSSSNHAVASFTLPHLNYQSFNIDAVGTTILTVTAADDVSATCVLNSTAIAMRDFIIKPQSDKTIFNKGEQNLLIVEFEPYFTTNRSIYWSSSDDNIATVKRIDGGYVTYRGQLWSVSEGSALVTFGDQEGPVEITAVSDEGKVTKIIRYYNYQR